MIRQGASALEQILSDFFGGNSGGNNRGSSIEQSSSTSNANNNEHEQQSSTLVAVTSKSVSSATQLSDRIEPDQLEEYQKNDDQLTAQSESSVLTEFDEESSIVALAKEEPQAFGILYERYVDRIYSYIYNRVGNVHDTEDLTARTFYKALDKLHSYEDRGLPFSAWLFRIAHNLVANWHRDHSRRRFLSLDRIWSHSHNETPEKAVERAENHSALWSAIERLPQERRNLLLYKFGSRLSNLEIGQLMDKSESAIKSLYFRTLAALRKDLESREW
ncbi:sigma-70 family RNA polymerase sigma factor [Chloroflexi bacterium TSY]|nr:sigma-70 family RNA polymerase sigma factor [Chloroflexi bacterium TSY]